MMMGFKKIILMTTLSTMALGTCSALAQSDGSDSSSNPYSFGGGACSSQGIWTRSALEGTHQIMRVITDLKDDKNCKGVKEALLSLGQQTEQMVAASDGGGTNHAERLGSLPNEISSLRSAIAGDKGLQGFGSKLLMSKNLENAALTAELGAGPFAALLTSGERVGRASTRGLELASAIATRMPDLDRCMMNSENNLPMVMGGAMQLVSAFVSSGNGFSKQVADTLLQIASVMRDRKYTRLLRKLQTSDVWTSMSCMIETATEAWCTTKDMQTIFKDGIKDLQASVVEDKIQNFDNPFQGYYILVQEVPVITSWMQKIQIGVDPRLKTDAKQQSNILDDLNEHVKKVKNLQGSYNNDLETLRKAYDRDDLPGKRVAVLNMISDLTDLIAPSAAAGAPNLGSNNRNFFTNQKTAEYIPFFLIGEDTIPLCVTGNVDPDKCKSPQDWDKFLQNGGKFKDRPKFNDPEQLAVTIGTNMRKLIEEANTQAINYFNKWFIVDKPTLVNESIMDTRYSVVEALQHILQYLTKLEARVYQYHGDVAIIPEITETRDRIKSVLDSYESVRQLARRAYKGQKEYEQYLIDAPFAYEKVIETVYEKFNVLLQKAGYIANRMSMFVYYDYSLMIRNNPDLSQYNREIFIASGQSIMDRLVQLYANNPSNVKSDLESAAVINKNALEAIEGLTRDTLHSTMRQLKMRPNDIKATNATVAKDSWHQIWKDTFSPRHIPGGAPNEHDKVTEYAKYSSTPWFLPKWFNADRYPMTLRSALPNGGDDENNSAKETLARLCTQTLAFDDWMLFADICEGSYLHSPLDMQVVTKLKDKIYPTSVSFNGYNLDVNYNTKSREVPNKSGEAKADARANQSARICAFRDYNRRNAIVWLTLQELKRRK